MITFQKFISQKHNVNIDRFGNEKLPNKHLIPVIFDEFSSLKYSHDPIEINDYFIHA
jgi:hypothetical protein